MFFSQSKSLKMIIIDIIIINENEYFITRDNHDGERDIFSDSHLRISLTSKK